MNIPHPRFLAFIAALVLATLLAMLRWPVEEAPILGFDIAVAVFIALTIPLWLDDDAKQERARAARDDGGRLFCMRTCIDPVEICSCYKGDGSDECDEGRQHQAVDGEA